MKKILLFLAVFMAMRFYAQEPLWWGYFSESDVSSIDGVGTGAKENFEAAIFIPANHAIVGGTSIKGLKIWFDASHISKFSSLKVWISKKLPTNAVGADYVQAVSVSTLKGGANEISLNTPYNVGNQAIYVGYTLGLTDAVYPIMNGGEWVENSFFIRSSVNVTDWSPLDYFGKLAMMLLLDGVVIEENAAVPVDFGTAYAVKGTTAKIPVTITNIGSKPLKNISYTVTTDGETSEEKTAQMGNLAFNDSKQVLFDFVADKETRKYEKTLTITKVNGVANSTDKKSAKGNLITITERPTVVPVVEEFTGTWCGWCTVGYDGMEKMHETYGDKVALIAVHNSDPMYTNTYDPIANKTSSYPSSFIDRAISSYPSAGNLDYYINQQINEKVAVASLQVSASWANSLKRSIRIDTRTKFVYSEDNGNYGIAFALVEDGMSGKTSDWAQANYLSGNVNYKDDYAFWYNSPSSVSGIKFNHVGIAAWDIANGVKNSVNPIIQAGEEQEFSFNANVSTNNLIQDKTKLKVVAMLIDRSTGFIVNAAQAAVSDYDPTGIVDMESIHEGNGSIFDMSGRKVSGQLKKGIYIINGRKVLY